MEWEKYYLDAILVPLGFVITISYYVWLWHNVRTQPFSTTIRINSHIRRIWVPSFLKDLEKKNILAVLCLRNLTMGCTLMATTSIVLSAGLATVISSIYSVKKPLNDAVYGTDEHNEYLSSLKYVIILTFFIFSFFCHCLSIRMFSQLSTLICTPRDDVVVASLVTPNYLTDLLEKGSLLNTVGNRLFYSALPLLLWIFGPILVFLCNIAILSVLYNLDFVGGSYDVKAKVETISDEGDTELV
ncbi:uncharacterized protein LOC129291272 [Prosopis cineraria]|uniref:uncharacterized protein LOC129291272 n=1 Tax=Prosopis cineraria TaxID=364024 RepID=UPI00240F3389|nr:uncharacterized protein LOC129291272 [Prosopis cineraria]